MGRRSRRAYTPICCRIGSTCAGYHSGFGQRDGDAVVQATRTIPVVFAVVADPVGSGYAQTLSRPGGNATGFMQFEYGLTGKWLELLHQIAPEVRRVVVFRDLIGGVAQFAVIQSIAPSVGIEVSPFDMRDAGEIERAITAFANSGNGGLIITASAFANVHRELLISLAASAQIASDDISHATSLMMVVSCPTGLTSLSNFGRRRRMPIAFSGARKKPDIARAGTDEVRLGD